MDASSHPLPKRILVIDDNVDASNMLADMLNLLGFAATAVHDGRRGVQLATQSLPHIVIVDLGMPNMDGFQVARALRTLPGAARLKIVALTGWNDAATRARVMACGFDDHLTKPASVNTLLETIESSP